MAAFRIKVRPAGTYLFGGASIEKEIESHFWLFVRVDEDGESVRLAVRKGAEVKATGTLLPGEAFLVRLDDIHGVIGTCDFETFADCELLTDGKGLV